MKIWRRVWRSCNFTALELLCADTSSGLERKQGRIFEEGQEGDDAAQCGEVTYARATPVGAKNKTTRFNCFGYGQLEKCIHAISKSANLLNLIPAKSELLLVWSQTCCSLQHDLPFTQEPPATQTGNCLHNYHLLYVIIY